MEQGGVVRRPCGCIVHEKYNHYLKRCERHSVSKDAKPIEIKSDPMRAMLANWEKSFTKGAKNG